VLMQKMRLETGSQLFDKLPKELEFTRACLRTAFEVKINAKARDLKLDGKAK
jgi:hypothetical protein